MAHPSRQLGPVGDPIDVVLRRPLALPPSPEVEQLRAKAEECLNETDGWKVLPPTNDERDKVMKRVLKIHVEVAKLERQRLQRGSLKKP
jgi:hypothetical protein